MACNRNHDLVQNEMRTLPIDQGGKGRHKCAACAYEKGFDDGYKLKERINLTDLLNSLDESQARNQRHRSPHAAYVKGYFDGVSKYYAEKNNA